MTLKINNNYLKTNISLMDIRNCLNCSMICKFNLKRNLNHWIKLQTKFEFKRSTDKIGKVHSKFSMEYLKIETFIKR